jgi:hypothetical protein
MLVVGDHALVRTGPRQPAEQHGFSVVDAATAQQRRSTGRAPEVMVIGANRPAACESINVIREAVPSAAALELALIRDNPHAVAPGAGRHPQRRTQELRTQPDHRVATPVSAGGCGSETALTLRQWSGKPHDKKPDDTVRRDLRKSMVKRLVPDAPTL